MKRFLKSKLVLSLAAFLMIAAAVGIPLSGFITHTHAQGTVSIPIPTITEYTLPLHNYISGSTPYRITQGPDGNLWFTEGTGFANDFITPLNTIGKITPSGKLTEYTTSALGYGPYGITSGPDGNLWFTEYGEGNGGTNYIGKISTSGASTKFLIPTIHSDPMDITSGPDGNLWFTEPGSNKIGKITTDGIITSGDEFPLPPYSSASDITSGPDGNLWFTDGGANKIGKITPSGDIINEYPILTPNSGPLGITTGPDGNLWFTESTGNKIGKITPSGAITEYPILTPNSGPTQITSGPDGNLWFTEGESNKIAQITINGIVTAEIPIPTNNSTPRGITSGPDGNIWFTETLGNKIGRVNLKSPLSITFVAAPPTEVPPTVYLRTGYNLAARVNVNPMEFTVVVEENGQPSAQPLTVHVDDSSQNGGSGHGPGGHPGVRPHGWLLKATDTQPSPNDVVSQFAVGGSQDTAGLDVQTNAGQATFVWLPPEIAGAETITVSIIGHPDVAPAIANIDVREDGFVDMPADPQHYTLIGSDYPVGQPPYHPSNHWATPATVADIQAAAQNYILNQQNDVPLQHILTQLTNARYGFPAATFPAGRPDLMQINDISLPWGGLFDVNGDWTTPHGGHRWGNMADFRTNYLVGDPQHPRQTALGDPNAPPPISNLVRRAHLQMFLSLENALIAAGGQILFEANHLHVVFPA